MPQKKPDTIPTHPVQQVHWVRIILGKLDTIQYPHTNRDTTLLGYHQHLPTMFYYGGDTKNPLVIKCCELEHP